MLLNEFQVAIFACPLFLQTALPCSGSYRERGGMPLHDMVGINCKKGSTSRNQGADVKYVGYGCMFDDCVCVCYPT